MAYDNVKQVVHEYGIAKMEFEKKMKGAFKDIFKTFFRDFPEIIAVGWNQYTPYFNDGDTCVFGVHDFYFMSANENGEELNIDDLSSAYDLDSDVFKYKPKPSEWTYANRTKYKSYDDDIVLYEKTVAENPRYGAVVDGIDELKDVLVSIPTEIYLSAFEDHRFVLATPKGIEVKEYEHD